MKSLLALFLSSRPFDIIDDLVLVTSKNNIIIIFLDQGLLHRVISIIIRVDPAKQSTRPNVPGLLERTAIERQARTALTLALDLVAAIFQQFR